ncbi:Nif11-like leader peptide family RiPP precursor [Sorangium sp. So ce131]|uniref:Nif11-like leader peptide family RiPP precursor n=1 Tax=Sorangium sp. So ce131 TaxID=3133282 RepID=UPI003F5EA35A
MNGHIVNTSVSRMDEGMSAAATTRRDARAFLAQVEVDEVLAAKMAEADGDMGRILAIASEAGCSCTERDLLRAYEQHLRSGPDAGLRDLGAAASAPKLGAPSDLSHAAVYLSLRAPADFGWPFVYLNARAPAVSPQPTV